MLDITPPEYASSVVLPVVSEICLGQPILLASVPLEVRGTRWRGKSIRGSQRVRKDLIVKMNLACYGRGVG